METRKRRKFSPEFKREAVKLACQPGQTIASVVRDLGIGANLLVRWKRKLAEHGRHAFRRRACVNGAALALESRVIRG
jgi:transposase